MKKQPYIVSLDIGSTQVRVVVARIEPTGKLQILGVGSAVSKGVQKGAIIDIEQAAGSIRQALEHVERMLGIEISEVYVGVSGNHLSLHESHGIVAIHNEDRVIGTSDIDRVIQASKVISIPEDHSFVEVLPKQFIVDGTSNIQDPTGMSGVRLEVDSLLVTGTNTILHNIIRCVERAGYQVAGLLYSPLALGETILTPDEKSLGSVLVDIGGNTMNIVIYQKGYLASAVVLKLGGEHITKDIMHGFQCQRQTAEELKCKYGIADHELVTNEKRFSLEIDNALSKEKEFSSYDLSLIMEPRIAEMFHLIRKQVELLGYDSQPAGGFVLTGGVMSTNSILSVAQKHLSSRVRIARPDEIGAEDPAYMAGIAMIRFLENRGGYEIPSENEKQVRETTISGKKKNRSAFEKVKNWLSEFI